MNGFFSIWYETHRNVYMMIQQNNDGDSLGLKL